MKSNFQEKLENWFGKKLVFVNSKIVQKIFIFYFCCFISIPEIKSIRTKDTFSASLCFLSETIFFIVFGN